MTSFDLDKAIEEDLQTPNTTYLENKNKIITLYDFAQLFSVDIDSLLYSQESCLSAKNMFMFQCKGDISDKYSILIHYKEYRIHWHKNFIYNLWKDYGCVCRIPLEYDSFIPEAIIVVLLGVFNHSITIRHTLNMWISVYTLLDMINYTQGLRKLEENSYKFIYQGTQEELINFIEIASVDNLLQYKEFALYVMKIRHYFNLQNIDQIPTDIYKDVILFLQKDNINNTYKRLVDTNSEKICRMTLCECSCINEYDNEEIECVESYSPIDEYYDDEEIEWE